MAKIFVINGSPRGKTGNTQRILNMFVEGIKEAGGSVELFFTKELDLQHCDCGIMYCWREEPGACCNQDDMQMLYPKLREAEILILATPIYVPMPGKMVTFINRLVPLIWPKLEHREGRTRALLREDVAIKKIVLVSTGGWYEIENFNHVVSLVEDLSATMSVEFGGAILRPHAARMLEDEQLTEAGEQVLLAVRQAGMELIQKGRINHKLIEVIREPLYQIGS